MEQKHHDAPDRDFIGRRGDRCGDFDSERVS